MSVGVLWLVSRAAGVLSLVLMTAALVAGTVATAPTRSRSWPRWARQALHRDLALLSVGMLVIHVAAVVVDSYVDVGWQAALVPFTSGYRTLAVGLGTIALDLVLVVVVTSLLRVRLGFRAWRAVHWLVYAAWPFAVLHYLLAGTDAGSPWGVALSVLSIGAVGTAVTLRALRSRQHHLPPVARAASVGGRR